MDRYEFQCEVGEHELGIFYHSLMFTSVVNWQESYGPRISSLTGMTASSFLALGLHGYSRRTSMAHRKWWRERRLVLLRRSILSARFS